MEKNEYGETALFPLSGFRPRQEENRERRCLGGSCGVAVPFPSDERFEAAVAARAEQGGAAAEERVTARLRPRAVTPGAPAAGWGRPEG